ncbi:MAG: prepilin-type N-terminal cleavage/methylation domain-containing protein [Verrucomicrobiae bacterium]|nr:prepilin-type N-terminal cleavage/methylation domain-containing protein [Verrucomicrobiae bacterium]
MTKHPGESSSHAVFMAIPLSAGRRQGFTLIELLAVVSIIGILAALLLGTVIGARRKALKTHCASNLRQLGVGLNHFVGDHGEYPLVQSSRSQGQYEHHFPAWSFAVEGTISGGVPQSDRFLSNGVWNCPAAASLPTKNSEYGYNGQGLGLSRDLIALGLGGHNGALGIAYVLPVKESEVKNPSGCMAIGDGFMGWKGLIQDGSSLLWRYPRAQEAVPGSTQRSRKRHGGRANVVFCDGHVESPTLDSLFVETTDIVLSRWNRDDQPHRERLNL